MSDIDLTTLWISLKTAVSATALSSGGAESLRPLAHGTAWPALSLYLASCCHRRYWSRVSSYVSN
ncbi:MAG: hypothetical protein NTX25_22865 [Proteobacteria bacterium]|nr:hypothetical protein [Pseudomonadota bacterium]